MDKGIMDELIFKCSIALSKLVGCTFTFKEEDWDTIRQLHREYYCSKAISSVEIEVSPMRHITFIFQDGSQKHIFNMEQLEAFHGQVGEFGSIYEYAVEHDVSNLFD